jgi:hypothetical protein
MVGCLPLQFTFSRREQTVCFDPDTAKVLLPRCVCLWLSCQPLDSTGTSVLMKGMVAPAGGTTCWRSVQYIALLLRTDYIEFSSLLRGL